MGFAVGSDVGGDQNGQNDGQAGGQQRNDGCFTRFGVCFASGHTQSAQTGFGGLQHTLDTQNEAHGHTQTCVYGIGQTFDHACQIGGQVVQSLDKEEDKEYDVCANRNGDHVGHRADENVVLSGENNQADRLDFLEIFLNFVKSKKLRLDFISLHNYGTTPDHLNNNTKPFNTQNNLDNHKRYFDVICKCGFAETPIIIDEWGMSSHGFFNREECPLHMCRETEVFSAYFVRLIYDLIHSEYKIDDLMICLSGQHEMTEDFTGFRNFFTLNFIAKPIYNAYILASKLNENILEYESDNKNLCVIPTRDEKGNYAVLMSYSSECFSEEISTIVENITFAENIKDKQVTIWCIGKETTNPYRLCEKLKINNPNMEEIRMLQEE